MGILSYKGCKKNCVFIALALAAALALSGCGAAPAVSSSSPASLSVASTASSSAPASVSASAASEEEQTFSGVLMGVGMSALTVRGADGTEASFLHDGASVPEDLQAGAAVTVSYTGTLFAADDAADACKLTEVTLTPGTQQVTGTVEGAAMHSFSLVLDDGRTLQFSPDDATVLLLSDGMTEGMRAAVTYAETDADASGAALEAVCFTAMAVTNAA